MAVSELKSQHRMQPHVANLIMLALYPGLEGHSSVTKTCKVKGVDQNIFFITHVHLADKVHAFSVGWIHTASVIKMLLITLHMVLFNIF